jgi:glycosyltransferase involved in cell wall biosynthesis
MAASPLVTVVTPTTGNLCVFRAIESVAVQSHKLIQHLLVIDNPDTPAEIKRKIREYKVDVIELPYATGKDRFNGHRIYGASAFLGKGDYFCFLDEDNWFDADHVASLIEVISRGFAWAYSLRKIVDTEGNFICNDDCESLGKWPSVLGERDYFVDANCYCLPRSAAVISSPIWYRRFREPNMLEVDRALMAFLRGNGAPYDCSYLYSVNYRVGNSTLSVRKEFFLEGNRRMQQQRQGSLPWKTAKGATSTVSSAAVVEAKAQTHK